MSSTLVAKEKVQETKENGTGGSQAALGAAANESRWAWILSYYSYLPLEGAHLKRLCFSVAFIFFFTIFLYTLPDVSRGFPHSDTGDAAEIIVGTYCNRSEVKRFLDDRYEQFGTKLGQELPPLHTGYLEGLSNFACHVPKKEILLLWSPSGNGVMKGLLEMKKIWRRQERVVVYVDLQYFTGDSIYKSMDKLLQRAILNGFQNHDISRAAIQGLDYFLRPKIRVDGNWYSDDTDWFTFVRQMTIKGIGYIPLIPVSVRNKLATFYDNKLADIDTYLTSFVTSDEEVLSEISLKTLFSAMEILTRFQPSFAPVIIFDHLEVLSGFSDSEVKTIVEDLVGISGEHEQEENVVPIILVSRDTLWFYKTDIFKTHGIFMPYRITELMNEDASRVLVDELKIWTNDEFSRIYNAVGGHSRSIGKIYKYFKFFSQPVDVAIDREKEFFLSVVLSAISKADSVEVKSILDELKSHNFTLVLDI